MSSQNKYVCIECGFESPKWMGKCTHCGSWSSFKEVKNEVEESGGRKKARKLEIKSLSSGKRRGQKRIDLGFSELNHVLGGGMVSGEVVLIGGEPGIGKTSLLLQIISNVHTKDTPCVYVSSEESLEQISLHAKRLGIKKNLRVLTSDDIDSTIATLEGERPKLVIIDSIQTVKTVDMKGLPGGIGQVKECAVRITDFAKKTGTAVVLVSHITKGGNLAGPKVLEHIVDAVLYLEGDPAYQIRLLRGIKNRFGSTRELGVFDFTNGKFCDAKNPAEMFIRSRKSRMGVCKGVVFEGQRAILVEVQALISSSSFSMPQRIVSGVRKSKIQMLSAVLSKYAKINLWDKDIYVNVANGAKIDDASVDMAICLALLSSYLNKKVDSSIVAIGEVSLTGQIHAGVLIEEKLKALKKLGYQNIILSLEEKGRKKSRTYTYIQDVNFLRTIFS